MNDAHARPFLAGAALVAAGVALHVWDYVEMREMGYRMVGMAPSATMLAGMALLMAGLAIAFAALLRPAGRRSTVRPVAGFESGHELAERTLVEPPIALAGSEDRR